MKKVYYTLLLMLGFNLSAQANPGDTTWVQANHIQLDYYNDFDTSVVFPDGSVTYRKIYMIFTLGQYDCDTSQEFCHQWDYTVQNYVMTKGGDTMELSRFITPYATSGWSRFGSSWKQPYVFDVTDFYPLLKDTAAIRIHYSGYSGGFTADVKFAFIEGVPDRNVTGIQELYDFSHSYGNAADPLNDHFSTLTETAPAGTESATLKYLVTGHGSDANGCCEFASHNYDVNLNGNSIAHKDIWRDDCGLNELYPQGGTWVYDRANWCPGARVRPIYHDLPSITAGSQYDINIQFEPYTTNSNFGSYTSSAIVFYHSGFNKTLDASLEDVIAPSNNPEHYRANPTGSIPQVLVHNSGSTAINQINFSYGVEDSTMQTYTWNGNLAPLADTLIDFPALSQLTNLSIDGATGDFNFVVTIEGVNGTTDEDNTNNQLISEFKVAPVWPGDIVLTLKTSNFIIQNGGLYQGNPDQKWIITDMNDNVVAVRNNTAADTKYTDTVALPAAGFYKLSLSTNNNSGLHWWPYDGVNGLHQGFFTVKKLNGTNIPMKNYAYTGQAHDDWGAAYSQYFTVAEAGHTSVKDLSHSETVHIYPNPVRDFIHIDFSQPLVAPVTIELVNVLGQTIYQSISREQHQEINTKAFASGVYTLLINSNSSGRKARKIVIKK